MKAKTPNFSGYVTKANLKCEDDRVILPNAFKHQDGGRVPLVFQHQHNDVGQVLGHVILTNKADGVWGDAFINEGTPQGKNALALVKHGDIDKFSIWAKNLTQRGNVVSHGDIKEVSLVLAGANPGALISELALAHSGFDEDENLVVVGNEIVHADDDDDDDDAGDTGVTIGEVLNTLDEDQTAAVNQLIEEVVTEAVAAAEAQAAVQHSALMELLEDNQMSRNVFDNSSTATPEKAQLKHADQQAFLKAALDGKVDSLKDFVAAQGNELMHAGDYGVDNIEILFPDAQALMRTPTWVDRRQEWVKTFINGTSKSPFSRIKTMFADITADEARARGYIKGNQKVEEVFPVFKRTTGPAMIYKKQKLDRQDIIDVTDFDIVAWMKGEMRMKLDEELARAGLFGDGRPVMVGGEMNPDKVQEPTGNSGDGIRSVLNDNDLYTIDIGVGLPANPTDDDWHALIDVATTSREEYLGSGNITAFMSFKTVAGLLTVRDQFGRRVYRNMSELAADMDFNQIVRVPSSLFPEDVLIVALDLADYNFGTNAGGQVSLFDDFDIDFNQYKYLMETYLSGALTLPYSAMVFRRETTGEGGTDQVTATAPTFVDGTDGTGTIEIPVEQGISYKIGAIAQPEGTTITINKPTTVKAVANPGYTLSGTASWTFTPTGG
jgi:HK97 family phage prohead protease